MGSRMIDRYPGHSPTASPSLARYVRRRGVCLGGLAFLTLLVYVGSLGYEFVYDEIGQIQENRFLEERDAIRRLIRLQTLTDGSIINGRRPVVLATYLLDHLLWDSLPDGWRLSNLIIHVAVVSLLFLFLEKLLRLAGTNRESARVAALIGALVFSWHPVNSEAVHIAAFRPDILLTFFLLAAMLCACVVSGTGRNRCLGMLCLPVLLVLGMGSKESALIVPVLVAVPWLLFPALRPHRALGVLLLGMLVVLAAGYIFLCLGKPPAGYPAASIQAVDTRFAPFALRPPANFLTAPWLFARYLKMLVVPYPLAIDHVVSPVVGLHDVRLYVGMASLALVAVGAWAFRNANPVISLGCLWILTTWMPVSNVVPLFNPFAERYAYAMTAGYALLAAGAIGWTIGRKSLWRRIRIALPGLLILLGSINLFRLRDYRDGPTLWTRTLAHEPESVRARIWLGLHSKHRGDLVRAEELFRGARNLNPLEVSAAVNEAIVRAMRGDTDGAVVLLAEAVRLRPDSAAAHANLAVALYLQGRADLAFSQIRKARLLAPDDPDIFRIAAALAAQLPAGVQSPQR